MSIINNNEVVPLSERDPYADYASELAAGRSNIVGQLLRFTKHGQYKSGPDLDPVAEGTRMLVYMPGMERGWIKWRDGQPVERVMGLVASGFQPPARDELDDLDRSTWGRIERAPDRPVAEDQQSADVRFRS